MTVNKAVTVVEIIKRRMEGSLHQYTQLGSVTSTEEWDPIKGKDMDRYLVTLNSKLRAYSRMDV